MTHHVSNEAAGRSDSFRRVVLVALLQIFAALLLCISITLWLYKLHTTSVAVSEFQQLPTAGLTSSHAVSLDSSKSEESPNLTCLNQLCGTVPIPYPFGLSRECARTSDYLLSCSDKSGQIEGVPFFSPLPGHWPYLTNISGIVSGTYWNVSDNSTEASVPFEFDVTEIQILNVTTHGTLIVNSTDFKAMGCFQNTGLATMTLPDSGPYRISSKNSVFIVGCQGIGNYSSDVGQGQCGPNSCYNNGQSYSYCNVYDCCTLQIPTSEDITLFGSGDAFAGYETCSFASILYPPTFENPRSVEGHFGDGTYGMEILWGLPVNETLYPNCSTIKTSPAADYACSPSATCTYVSVYPPAQFKGYYCNCSVSGYEGDGYLKGTGCKDINECEYKRLNDCVDESTCHNTDGSYNCSCPILMDGDGRKTGSGCKYINYCETKEMNNCTDGANCIDEKYGNYSCQCTGGLVGDGYQCMGRSPNIGLIVGVSAGGALVFMIIVLAGACIFHKNMRQNIYGGSFGPDFSRADFLREIQGNDGANICRLFTYDELAKATNNFSPDKVLGSGGFGTVFEGTLSDGRKLAIKRTRHDVGTAREDTKQFINEVTILSQVNHRNLVKLLGCCLETPVPVLVYEFISNGTLLEHLRPESSDSAQDRSLTEKERTVPARDWPPLDWRTRLKIAVGTAEALGYLHSGTSPPIYHRDVKTANILLDDEYVVKVADFGISKLVELDVTHLSTRLQGTPGYLDPEYFDTYQITDKSDVYSFGVVLLELITSEKPVDITRQARDHNLALRCNRLWKHGRLADIIDPVLRVSNDSELLESVFAVAKVAMQCVERHREDRPKMHEVLEQLKSVAKDMAGNDSNEVNGVLNSKTVQKSKILKNVRFEDLEEDVRPLTAEMMSSNSHELITFSDSASTEVFSPGFSSSNNGGSTATFTPRGPSTKDSSSTRVPAIFRKLLRG